MKKSYRHPTFQILRRGHQLKWVRGIDMDDFAVLVGVLASSSFAINLYLIKSVATLCEKVARLEGKLSSQA